MKGILIVDIPNSCKECRLNKAIGICMINIKSTRPARCPIHKMPEKMEICGRYLQEGPVPSYPYRFGWNDCIDQITEGEAEVNDSEQEAQVAGAGEIKNAISQKLEEVRADIVNIRHMLITEDTALDQAILSWKKAQLEKWAIFLEDLLSGGVKKSVGEDWKQRTMERFERVE